MGREALESGDFQGIPLMTGTCRDEGLLILSHILKEPARWDTQRERADLWAKTDRQTDKYRQTDRYRQTDAYKKEPTIYGQRQTDRHIDIDRQTVRRGNQQSFGQR